MQESWGGGGEKKEAKQLGYKLHITQGGAALHSEQCWPDTREIPAGSAQAALTECFFHLSWLSARCMPLFRVAISCQLLARFFSMTRNVFVTMLWIEN